MRWSTKPMFPSRAHAPHLCYRQHLGYLSLAAGCEAMAVDWILHWRWTWLAPYLQLGIKIRLSNVLDDSHKGNWMVNISYFCRPEPWRNMSSSTCGCWMLLVGLILKCHRLNSTKLHRDTLGIGAVSVKSYWDHTVQVYIRVLITIPPKKTNLSKRVFSLVTSVCTEPRNRKN